MGFYSVCSPVIGTVLCTQLTFHKSLLNTLENEYFHMLGWSLVKLSLHVAFRLGTVFFLMLCVCVLNQNDFQMFEIKQ